MFLRELHSYKVTQPLLFALLSRYIIETDSRRRRRVAKWIHTRLKHITSFVLRTAFVAPKFEPSHFEGEFSDLAEQIASAEDVYIVDVDVCLKDCDSTYGIMDDNRFKARVSEIEMRDAKKVKRFLFGVSRRSWMGGRTFRSRRLVNYACVSHEQRIDIRIPLVAVPLPERRRVGLEIAAARGSLSQPLAAKMLAV